MPWTLEFWTTTLTNILTDVTTWLPRLFGALILFVMGWFVARLVQVVLAGLLRRLGLDRLAERAGVNRFLVNTGLDASVANLLARVVYWLILFVFILAAVESLGLSGVSETIANLINFLPSVLAAAIILLLGALIARVLGEAVGAMAVQSGITTGLVLGQTVQYILLIFAVILALEQLGVETVLLTTVAAALISATALALALAFGLGNRDLARNIMAGFHAREVFALGQNVTLGSYHGRLIAVGTVKAVIETEAGQVTVPNSALIDEAVVIRTADEAEA